MKNKRYILLLLLFIPILSFSKTLAICNTELEHAYYPAIGMLSDNDSGWKISADPGAITLNELPDGNFDILFTDALSKTIKSARRLKAKIELLWKQKKDMAFTVTYPNYSGIEIYHFTKINRGKNIITILSTKGGNNLFYKSSVENGVCSFVSYD